MLRSHHKVKVPLPPVGPAPPHSHACLHTRVHACVFVCVFVFVCVCVHRVWRIYVRNLPSVCPSKFPFSIPFFLEAKKGKKESLLNRQKNRFLPSVY